MNSLRFVTHKTHLLLDEFLSGCPLVVEPVDEGNGPEVKYQLHSKSNGDAALFIPADRRDLVATIEECRSEPLMLVFARVLLMCAWELHGRKDAWHYERIIEILLGRRRRRGPLGHLEGCTHRRERIQRLERLFADGYWVLNAPVRETAIFDARGPRPRRRPRRRPRTVNRRNSYGGTFEGSLVKVNRTSRSTATMYVSEELRLLWGSWPYMMVPPEVFQLPRSTRARKDGTRGSCSHENPRGHGTTKGERTRFVLGALTYVRKRGGRKKLGDELQPVDPETFLEDHCHIALTPCRRRRLPTIKTQMIADLNEIGGEVDLDHDPLRPMVRMKASDVTAWRPLSTRIGSAQNGDAYGPPLDAGASNGGPAP
jgi:hypothetical protein